MYNSPTISSILIVKTSSIGDIIQAFPTLSYLRKKFPAAQIDWAVEKSLEPLVKSHADVSRSIPVDWSRKALLFKKIREVKYDILFDLQGNCKSGLITLCARARVKVGFSYSSAREWPNALATNVRYPTVRSSNICLQYMSLAQNYFKDEAPAPFSPVWLSIQPQERAKIEAIAAGSGQKIMVCPGSKWANKRLPLETLLSFLEKVDRDLSPTFYLMWGSAQERSECEEIAKRLPHSLIVERLSLPSWQNLMGNMDLVIAVDSSALHLAALGGVPTFSFFGPTLPEVFKPAGEKHCAIRGSCPYNRVFEKQCPILRSCKTGACVRDLKAEEIYLAFIEWRSRSKSMCASTT
jgi:heptosyltransferase-1